MVRNSEGLDWGRWWGLNSYPRGVQWQEGKGRPQLGWGASWSQGAVGRWPPMLLGHNEQQVWGSLETPEGAALRQKRMEWGSR